MTVRVRDEAPGDSVVELDLDLHGATFTAAELIRGRVAAELIRRGTEPIRPLVQPTAAELALNGPRRPSPGAPSDVEHETARAIEALRRGRFVLMVDRRQVLDPEERIELTPATQVTFLRLVPLQGG
jgi:hypothetical protein